MDAMRPLLVPFYRYFLRNIDLAPTAYWSRTTARGREEEKETGRCKPCGGEREGRKRTERDRER